MSGWFSGSAMSASVQPPGAGGLAQRHEQAAGDGHIELHRGEPARCRHAPT
ncbi:MAG: hypothetical protein R2851_22280 [Caldilineaceae bacterium]